MFIEISAKLIETLKGNSRSSLRRRVNYNFHNSPDDPVNRMLQVMNVGSYVQPHCHKDPDKREVFILLEGRVAVFEFDEEGAVLQCTILDRSLGKYGVEIPPGTWHTLLVLEDETVIYEVKDGPYDAGTDKIFAPWAPSEKDEESLRSQFLISLQDFLHSRD
ncbi:MAG: WbuC family cupin fold metalloprotein [Bacteroidales bacterium]|nr:WbuC family cupin fold metalloprotein [Bacteroidales bacterium]